MDCIFCKIRKGEIPSNPIYQDKNFIAINDINPKAPIHVLLIPKKHLISLQKVNETDEKLMGKMIMLVNKIAIKIGIADSGYKVVINNGEASGQLVYHLHLHILGGWEGKTHWKV